MEKLDSKVASLKLSDSGKGKEEAGVENGIRVESFQSRNDEGTLLNFIIYHMKDSYFIWLGLGPVPATMPHLVMGAMNKFDQSTGAISSTIANYNGDSQSAQSIARRLSKRTGKLFFVTSTIPDQKDSDSLLSFAEQQILAKIIPQK